MFSVDFNKAALELTNVRLMQFSSRVRRTVLHRVGTATTKEVMSAVRGGRVPAVFKVLARSFRRKVKVYTASANVFGIVGSDRMIREQQKQYKDYKTGQIRTWRNGGPAKGPKYAAPAKYIHLAGAGRKSKFMQDALKSVRPRLDAISKQVLTDEVNKV